LALGDLRLTDLSLIKYLTDSLSGVEVLDSAPDSPMVFSKAVIVENLETTNDPIEITGDGKDKRKFIFHVLSKSKGECEDLQEFVCARLLEGIPLYDFDANYTSPPTIGRIHFSELLGIPDTNRNADYKGYNYSRILAEVI